MCGICGIYGSDDAKLVRRMTDLLSHRGPDDCGHFSDAGVALGHRRLSIIDVAGGRQPISNENGTVWVVFNGEIYNYRELRKELEAVGHVFRTGSDTEVLAHLYETHGPGGVARLVGIFAYALWDAKRRRLMLARDHAGIKPLYYTRAGGLLAFASEMKALLLLQEDRGLDPQALADFLSLRYVPGERTLLRAIRKVPPAHVALVDAGGFRLEAYWSLPAPPRRLTEGAVPRLRRLLEESVTRELMSEVPLGVFLSGGLDSSVLAALAARGSPDPLRTFAVGYAGDPESELEAARLVAEHLGADHKEILIEPDVVRFLPEVVWHLDEPLADVTTFPTYLVARQARRYVTVALLGEGADELFGSYAHEKTILRMERWFRRTGPLRPLAPAAARALPEGLLNRFFDYPLGIGRKGKERLVEFLRMDPGTAEAYLHLQRAFPENELRALADGLPQCSLVDALSPSFARRPLDAALLEADLRFWLPGYQLLRVDRLSMAHGLEARVPYLEIPLLEFSVALDPSLKLRGSTEKFALRRAARDLLPSATVNQRKRPFITPMPLWGERVLLELADQLLEKPCILTRFHPETIRSIRSGYRASKLIAERQLWTLIAFAAWHEVFVDGNPLKPPHPM